MRVWCRPGNTNDQSLLEQVKDDLRSWKLGRVITVVDRGFSSAANLAYLRRAGGHRWLGPGSQDASRRTGVGCHLQGTPHMILDFPMARQAKLFWCPDPRKNRSAILLSSLRLRDSSEVP